jgi:peptidyl-prolyl cis-trans isomerase C
MAAVDSSVRFPAPAKRPGWLGSFLRRAAREPLLHFLLLGAVIFAIGEYNRPGDDQHRVVVDHARVAKLAETYVHQFGGQPSPQVLRTLIDNDVNEEILYREGIAMGLDRNDEVIRRRVVQKVQFLDQDLAPPTTLSDASLRAFYDAHHARYTVPARVSFTHIYFSPDKSGDASARARAQTVLASLNNPVTRAPDRGDAYPDLYDYSAIGPDDAKRLFGDTAITHDLFKAPADHWSGPFRSGYGWHLVYVSNIEPAHVLPFAQVRDDVRTDYQTDAQTAANDHAFADLKARYNVVREDKP